MEVIYEMDVGDMPVTVAVNINGCSVHEIGQVKWGDRIAATPVKVAK